MTDKILIDRSALQGALELLMVGIYNAPELQVKRTQVINDGLRYLREQNKMLGDQMAEVEAIERERLLNAASDACRAFGKTGAVVMCSIRAKIDQVKEEK